MPPQTATCSPSRCSTRRSTSLSRPVGARITIRSSGRLSAIVRFAHQRGRAGIGCGTGQHALELLQHRADANAFTRETVLPDGWFVDAASLLDDRYRFANLAARLEIAQQNDRIAEKTQID